MILCLHVHSPLFVAHSKVEECKPPTVDDLQYLCDGTYSHEQIRQMEHALLEKLQFAVLCPTLWSSLEFFLNEHKTLFDRTEYFFANVCRCSVVRWDGMGSVM